MIDEYFEILKKSMKNLEPVSSAHMPAMTLSPIEQELLFGKVFEQKVPDNFPMDYPEGHGFRRIRNPFNANYKDVRLRIGTTVLHLRAKVERKNLESVVMVDIGKLITTNFAEAKAHASESAALVFLHDNGVVSAAYLNAASPYALVNSWFPDGKSGYAGFPYPRSEPEVAILMLKGIKKVDMPQTEKFSHIPDLVMLAVRSYESISKG